LVIAHPFYHARQVQKHFAVITDALAAAKSAKLVGDQVVHLADALSEIQKLKGALDEYYDFDAQRPNRVVSEAAFSGVPDGIWHKVSYSTQIILAALKCRVSQMREPG
jgi:hypothetical protein